MYLSLAYMILFVVAMQSSDPDQQLLGTTAARKTLSREQNPPIKELVDAGIVPMCVRFLEDFTHPVLQFEAAWTLTNVASGTSEQTQAVVNAGAIPRLVKLLTASQDITVVEQVVWALGNIAGDGPNYRDAILNHDALPAILELVRPDTPVSISPAFYHHP